MKMPSTDWPDHLGDVGWFIFITSYFLGIDALYEASHNLFGKSKFSRLNYFSGLNISFLNRVVSSRIIRKSDNPKMYVIRESVVFFTL